MLEVPETSGRGGGRSRAIAPSRANGTAPGRERVSGSYRANVAPNRAARQARPQGQMTGEISVVSPDIPERRKGDVCSACNGKGYTVGPYNSRMTCNRCHATGKR